MGPRQSLVGPHMEVKRRHKYVWLPLSFPSLRQAMTQPNQVQLLLVHTNIAGRAKGYCGLLYQMLRIGPGESIQQHYSYPWSK